MPRRKVSGALSRVLSKGEEQALPNVCFQAKAVLLNGDDAPRRKMRLGSQGIPHVANYATNTPVLL